ncbi:MAG: NADP-dependent oxidoreductase [Cryobacterium sp.]|nr:NADP-dependent oxidoreductase [Oligoflexia bacterium]
MDDFRKSSATTDSFVLAKRPVGAPVLSDFKRISSPVIQELKENEVRVHGLYYSVDPAEWNVGEVVKSEVVARVAESKSSQFRVGELVIGEFPWSTESVVLSDKVRKIDIQKAFASEYLGVLGQSGLAAYFGLVEIGKPIAGETLVISGASGAVGSLVGQIGKLFGCRVVGITSSEIKMKFLTAHLGFHASLNHLSDHFSEELEQACPNGIDIYFDDVGGSLSDSVMKWMNHLSRVVICGQISSVCSEATVSGKRIESVLLNRSILMQGFRVSDYEKKVPAANLKLTEWLTDGKIESTETILRGFDRLPEASSPHMKASKLGKMIVKAEDWL